MPKRAQKALSLSFVSPDTPNTSTHTYFPPVQDAVTLRFVTALKVGLAKLFTLIADDMHVRGVRSRPCHQGPLTRPHVSTGRVNSQKSGFRLRIGLIEICGWIWPADRRP